MIRPVRYDKEQTYYFSGQDDDEKKTGVTYRLPNCRGRAKIKDSAFDLRPGDGDGFATLTGGKQGVAIMLQTVTGFINLEFEDGEKVEFPRDGTEDEKVRAISFLPGQYQDEYVSYLRRVMGGDIADFNDVDEATEEVSEPTKEE